MSDTRQGPRRTPADAAELRRIAEEKAGAMGPDELGALSSEETGRLIHELRVHQIQLEMQNEELRRAQAELGAAKDRYFDLYDLAPVGYCTVSENNLILEANLTAATLLGMARGALVRQPLTRFICKEDQDIYYRRRKALFETGEPQVCDFQMVRPDGALFWARLHASAVKGEEGGEPVCRAVISDITEQKRAEDQVRRLQKFESLGRMAGAVAHHFNNQLQAVMGNLELATSDLPKGSEESLYSLNEAMQAARRAAEVSTSMLTYLGQTPGTRHRLDLSATCRLSLPMLQAASTRRAVLTTEFPLPGPAVHADAKQIQQVLTNLVANAWEAVGDGAGTITVAVKTVPAADIPQAFRFPIGWRPGDTVYACLEVADTGCGIDAADMERLFEPFFSTKFTGRGLGLPVVLGTVRAHGGCIAVESQMRTRSSERGTGKGKDGGQGAGVRGQGAGVRGLESGVGGQGSETLGVLVHPVAPEDGTGASLRENSVGSVFRVFLPLMEGEVSRVEKKSVSAGDAIQGGGTVLLVEDTEQVRKLGVRMLELMGFTVLAAKDGMEGVEMFRERRDEIRFVLSDLTMPRMDGWKTIAALREIDPNVPIILTSGYDEVSVMSGDHAQRPQVFLGKPYILEDLHKAIGKVIEPQMDTDQHRFKKTTE